MFRYVIHNLFMRSVDDGHKIFFLRHPSLFLCNPRGFHVGGTSERGSWAMRCGVISIDVPLNNCCSEAIATMARRENDETNS